MRKLPTRITVSLAAAAAGAALATAPTAAAEPSVHQIVFRVFGAQSASLVFGPQPGSLINVTYKTQSTAVNTKLVPVPWNLSFQARGDERALARTLDLSAALPESQPDGQFTCEISVDGQVQTHVEGDLSDGLHCALGVSGDDGSDGDED
ncbi:hypothetical protein [Segniliparus rugosus]|uniref:Uncharacterized protein n=1 Tax=Segniliparus rugosus (strain ATCC BAA-974 / DSM 45345 / CCUG 50838 / CIP 108380 / JCM 13579 / CDC 945) TaxID=679197 RepID=E5XQ19_SEGRC|nr:hypothetical protein [Segniliparus rugosus]EFV13552.2 hypothetical protein HMPREF9336_01591 [Segniliparus rugosus ATCC BAA-974]